MHTLTRIGSLALIFYLFLTITKKLAPKTSGNYPSMGFLIAFLGIGSVLILIIFGLLIADSINLHKKKELLLRNISLAIILIFIIFLWYYIPKI